MNAESSYIKLEFFQVNFKNGELLGKFGNRSWGGAAIYRATDAA
jgi:hypothetical protein